MRTTVLNGGLCGFARILLFYISLYLKPSDMTENDIAREVVDSCYHIHKELGPGLLESVYEEVLFDELTERGFSVSRQQVIPLIFRGKKYDKAFRTDLIVDKMVIVEIKSVETVLRKHQKTVQTYLRLTDLKLALLVNFNESIIKNGIQRIVNNL